MSFGVLAAWVGTTLAACGDGLLAGWLADWLAGWLAGWLAAGWLAGY